MLTIKENAEDRIFQDLNRYRSEQPTYRCLYLKLSSIQDKHENWQTLLNDTLKDHIQDNVIHIYICHDTDIFVLTRTTTQKRLQSLLLGLMPQLTPAPLEKGLASLFEIGVDWDALRALCIQKIESRKQAQIIQNKNDVPEKKPRFDVLKSIDPTLSQTIGARRDSRSEPHIMIVEDDPFSQTLINKVLNNAYDTSLCDDGVGAVMQYVTKAPDVLFLDIGLPDISGLDVLEKIFVLDPDAFVVMLSGHSDRDHVLKAVALGAQGFIAKPFTQEKLFQYIAKSPFIAQKTNQEAYCETY